MERNVLLANIVGLVISAVGVILYASGYVKGERVFRGWRTIVGFVIAAMGGIFILIASGALS